MYNLYADVLLGLDFVPSEVYSTVTTYYNNLISCELSKSYIHYLLTVFTFPAKGGFGIPLMNEVPGLTSVCMCLV